MLFQDTQDTRDLYPETPCLLADEARVMANINNLQRYADKHGLILRPHIKTHRSSELARRQIAAGAAGITCQKVGEAETMVAAGCEDILITYNILGERKLSRLKALAAKCRLATVADSEEVVRGLSETFAGSDKNPAVLVECDTGLGRCGVQTPSAAVALAEIIDQLPGLELRGLMTYPPAGETKKVADWLRAAKERFDRKGLRCDWISGGNTPDMLQQHEAEILTEIRSGTYIFNDRMMARAGVCKPEDAAVRVRTTVVSRPTADRAIIDAGVKTLSAETGGFKDYGVILEYPQARIYALNEEHGYVRLPADGPAPQVGECVHLVPNHICVTFNLHPHFFLMNGDRVVARIPIDARGQSR